MSDKKIMQNIDTVEENKPELTAEELKREFIKKFGKYALSAPVGVFLLMSPNLAKKAIASSGGNDGG